MSTVPEGATEIGRGLPGNESMHGERRETAYHTRPQGCENPTALPVVRPLGNPCPALNTSLRLLTTELALAMHNKPDELADLAGHKNFLLFDLTHLAHRKLWSQT